MDHDIVMLFKKLIQGDRVALGKAMTLVESDLFADRLPAINLLEQCEKHLESKDSSIRFAISGAPGAGKSTLIEAIGLKAISDGHTVGVITVDPTSSISHGSILGDKSRMTELSVSPDAFIRSSAAGTVLGGLGRRSHEMMTLLAAAGYDLIFLETVGVGQSEHMAWQFTDGFILVLQPGGGDELQSIKRGITELADIILVNKADGELLQLAKMLSQQYQRGIPFFTSLRAGWTPKIVTCSAIAEGGIDEVWDILRLYRKTFLESSSLPTARKQQKMLWLSWSIGITANQLLLNHPQVKKRLEEVQMSSENKNISIFKTEFEIENVIKAILDKSIMKNEE